MYLSEAQVQKYGRVCICLGTGTLFQTVVDCAASSYLKARTCPHTKAAGKGRWCTHKGSRSKTQTVKQTVKQIVNVFGVAVLLHLTMKTGTALSAK